VLLGFLKEVRLVTNQGAAILGYGFCSDLRDSGKILKERSDQRIRRRKELVGKAEDPPASAMSLTCVLRIYA
jgi:hypothetical protein